MHLGWKRFIYLKHQEYKKIGHVKCPAFSNEEVAFNKHGFTHLIRKEGLPRTKSEQVRRLGLLRYAIKIVSETKEVYSFEKRVNKGKIGHFWTLISMINTKEIKVVIRQIGNGRKHFFSIMDHP